MMVSPLSLTIQLKAHLYLSIIQPCNLLHLSQTKFYCHRLDHRERLGQIILRLKNLEAQCYHLRLMLILCSTNLLYHSISKYNLIIFGSDCTNHQSPTRIRKRIIVRGLYGYILKDYQWQSPHSFSAQKSGTLLDQMQLLTQLETRLCYQRRLILIVSLYRGAAMCDKTQRIKNQLRASKSANLQLIKFNLSKVSISNMHYRSQISKFLKRQKT